MLMQKGVENYLKNTCLFSGERLLPFGLLVAYAKTTAKLISAFIFAIRIVQSHYYPYPKFQASGHLLWLYSPACVGPGRKPCRPVFSQRGSNDADDNANSEDPDQTAP